jgi:hypothetical protein
MTKPDPENPSRPQNSEIGRPGQNSENGRPVRVGPDDKLHSLISQVEELNHLCAGGISHVCAEGLNRTDDTKNPQNTAPDHTPSPKFTQHLQLGELILRALDDNITPSSFAQLEKWIMENPDALRYYLDYVCLCACLQASGKKDSLLKDFQLIKSS